MAMTGRKSASKSTSLLILTIVLAITTTTAAFVQPSAFRHSGPLLSSSRRSQQQWHYAVATSRRLAAPNDDSNRLPEFDLPEDQEAEAERLRNKAEQLRRQIRDMEAQLGSDRGRSNQVQQETPPTKDTQPQQETQEMSLRNKRVLVAGANGRLGSMVCRHLLREHPELREVVAAVHVVGENSSTARGYGRLAYEVGAEDGAGSIGPAWSSAEERTATFRYDGQVMAGYNLQKMRIVECELLDPVQCESILSDNDVDAVIWCATDFNGNTPRAVSGLNVAFLFRAVASPTKGRVEIEGLQNMLGAFKKAKQDRKWKSTTTATTTAASATTTSPQRSSSSSSSIIPNEEEENPNDPLDFVLVSVAPDTLGNFETPFGEFNAIKREAEQALQSFPSLTHTVLQMGRYEDNFVEEGLPVILEKAASSDEGDAKDRSKRRCINRRDAAKAAVDALTNKDLKGETVRVYTAKR